MASLVVEVILSNEKRVGYGDSSDDPVRQVWQMFTLDGILIVEIDPWANTHVFNQHGIDELTDTPI